MTCEIEINDGEDMVEVDEIATDTKTLDLRKSNSESTEPNDDVFPTIPPEEIEKEVIKKRCKTQTHLTSKHTR